MKSILFPLEQLKSIFPSVIVSAIFSLLIIASVLGLHFYNDIPLYLLTTDVTVAANAPLYFGIQSQIGIFFWAATAAICSYSSNLVMSKPNKNFLLVSASISLFLGLDDIFMFHEIVFPSLGVPQKVVYLSYALLMLLYGFKFLKTLLSTEYVLFALAIGFFGISLLTDNFLKQFESQYITQLLEDGA
ncbi:MAG: hypothetical protein KDD03_08100 [Gelidibacter sp.]|nr:hypothetical protein [Gelidibacter sp.]